MTTGIGAITDQPRYFMEFLKRQDEPLYVRVVDLIVFEEVLPNIFRLQKLYQKGIWDRRTETSLDLLWWDYCNGNY
jgi:hypothetical protein